ncbi:MAG: selenocysteine-specific translation elongation factor [Bacteroidales bacterium]
MDSIIVSTAGHVDHGKTALVQALTGIDCDTSIDEKKRGITINPGYAYLKRYDGSYVAFVDVPGHERLVNNMISGAGSTDFLMMVIAADDGIMPQTIEHFRICSILGITEGIIVITKIDLISPSVLAEREKEIRKFFISTFLENKPIFKVSVKNHMGIEELSGYFDSLENVKTDKIIDISQKDINFQRFNYLKKNFFCLSVDRVFTKHGFGVIVTGTVRGHSVSKDDVLYLHPSNQEIRIRSMQMHMEEVDYCEQGSRVALNLRGCQVEDITKGDILATEKMHATNLIDAKIQLFDSSQDYLNSEHQYGKSIRIWLFSYTKKIKAVIKFLTNDLVQISIPEFWYFVRGERFIIRNESSIETLGGGIVIDSDPFVHKKISDKIINNLTLASAYDSSINMEFILIKSLRTGVLRNIKYFSEILMFDELKVRELLNNIPKITIIDNNLMSTNLLFLYLSTHKEFNIKDYIDKNNAYINNDTVIFYPESVSNRKALFLANKWIRDRYLYDIKLKITKWFSNKPEDKGIRLGEFRELAGVNRKTAISLIELFEKEKFLIRKEDFRFLNKQ